MELRVPSGAAFLDGLGHDLVANVDGAAVVATPTPTQLDEAIAALARGEVEYLGLHQHDAFVQVAGEGVGPYELEASLGTVEQQVAVPGGVTLDGVRVALHGFLAGDLSWPQAFPWEPVGRRRPPRRRWFGRG